MSSPAPHPDCELLTDVDVARLLRCSRRQVHYLAERGEIPAPVKLGRLTRWRPSDLAAWVRDGCGGTVPH